MKNEFDYLSMIRIGVSIAVGDTSIPTAFDGETT